MPKNAKLKIGDIVKDSDGDVYEVLNIFIKNGIIFYKIKFIIDNNNRVNKLLTIDFSEEALAVGTEWYKILKNTNKTSMKILYG